VLPDNSIHTSKYTLVNFLPKQLFEQFSKLANLYFLVIGFMQIIPQVSISNSVPVIFMPLFFIVLVSALKDLYEDYKRRSSDQVLI
jgi:phospholipid-transporting ATPase